MLAVAVFMHGCFRGQRACRRGGCLYPAEPKPPKRLPELVEQGRSIYFRRCSFCHGLLGDGNGPAADYLDPRPRDFTLGTFKFRTTQSGELPTDEDLFRTVSRGLSGTGMQAFDSDLIKNGLSEAGALGSHLLYQDFCTGVRGPGI